MERVTISLDDPLMGEFDSYLKHRAMKIGRRQSAIWCGSVWSGTGDTRITTADHLHVHPKT